MAKPVKLKGVTLFYPNLSKENELSGKYQVDLANLTDKQVEGIEALGVEAKNKSDDRDFFVTCKSEYPIDVYDTEGDAIRGQSVGNGTIADVVVTPYDWTFKKKKGVSLGINKVVITHLEVYESVDDVNMDDIEEL